MPARSLWAHFSWQWFFFSFISSALKLLGAKSESSWRREGRLYVQEMLMGQYKWEGAGGVEGRQPHIPELVSCAWDLHQWCHTPLRKTFQHLWLQEGIRDSESVLKTKIVGERKTGQAVVSIDFQFFPKGNMSYFFRISYVELLTHPDLTHFQGENVKQAVILQVTLSNDLLLLEWKVFKNSSYPLVPRLALKWMHFAA